MNNETTWNDSLILADGIQGYCRSFVTSSNHLSSEEISRLLVVHSTTNDQISSICEIVVFGIFHFCNRGGPFEVSLVWYIIAPVRVVLSFWTLYEPCTSGTVGARHRTDLSNFCFHASSVILVSGGCNFLFRLFISWTRISESLEIGETLYILLKEESLEIFTWIHPWHMTKRVLDSVLSLIFS